MAYEGRKLFICAQHEVIFIYSSTRRHEKILGTIYQLMVTFVCSVQKIWRESGIMSGTWCEKHDCVIFHKMNLFTIFENGETIANH